MNKYRKEYEDKKQRVIEILNKTKEYYKKNNDERQVEIISNNIKTVENDEFVIVLVGEFSAGKSTFLNALMGERLLPSFTRETTATINYLKHKDRSKNGEEGIVYFTNGEKEILQKADFKTISSYVSTESSLNVVRRVDHVDLFLDSKFLEGNITLVDSPGLNGVADGHREVTEKQIEQSSASIFMFKADQPGSDTDFKFIADLRNKINTIIFALNKIDEIKVSEGETPESVIDSLKSIYKERFPDADSIPEIWGISAYQALVARSNQSLDYRGRHDYTKEEKEKLESDSKMNEFEDRLWQFMTKGEKAKAMLLSPVEKVINCLERSNLNMQDELKLLENKGDKEDIENNICEINSQINDINENIKSIESDIEQNVSLAIDEFKEKIYSKFEKMKESQLKKLYTWDDLEELQYFECNVSNEINRQYKKIIKSSERELIREMESIIAKNYIDVAKDINNTLKDIDLNVSVDIKYNLSNMDYEIGIQKYENEIKEYKKKIEEKQKQIENAEISKLKARKIERDIKSIENKINSKKCEQEYFERMIAPTQDFRDEQVYEKRARGGVLGFALDVIVGEKDVLVTKSKVLNKDEIEEFRKYKNEKIKGCNENIEELNKKIEDLNKKYEESSTYELQEKNLLRQLEEIKDEKSKLQNEFKENYIKKNKITLKKKRNDLEEYFDEVGEEYYKSIDEELYKQEKVFCEIIKSSIANNLQVQLEQKNEKLKSLQNKLQSSQEEKKSCEEKLNIMIEESLEILREAISLQSDLNLEEVDHIKQMEL